LTVNGFLNLFIVIHIFVVSLKDLSFDKVSYGLNKNFGANFLLAERVDDLCAIFKAHLFRESQVDHLGLDKVCDLERARDVWMSEADVSSHKISDGQK
jgi:hypothetical protein